MNPEDELQRAVNALTNSIEQLRHELVRKDVYDAREATRDVQIKGLTEDVGEVKALVEKIEERRAADRRLLITAFAAPFVLLIIQLFIAAQTAGPTP